jgi:DNA-binding response OmpR family regulator
MPKIMIIEDDEKLRKQVCEVLESNHYEIYAVNDFHNVEADFKEISPDLVILDINLPEYDGNYYCRIFRRISNKPIIITSARNSETDQILGMELGADDYVVKPFNIQVLLAKINAVMRRLYGEYKEEEKSEILHVQGILLDEKSFKISYRQKTEELSKNEFKLLKKFMENNNQVISREELLEEIWDESDFVDDNTLTVNVTRLKNKLGELGICNAIRTKRGLGYIMDTEHLN